MNEITVFNNEEFGQIRTLCLEGEPWFVGKDVADKLGYAASRNAIAKNVDKEDKKGAPIQCPLGGKQNMTIINESGLFSLILNSKLPTAKKFRKWVTSEVIPSIRKTGYYSLNGADQNAFILKQIANGMEILSELASELVHQLQAIKDDNTKMKIEIASLQSAMKYQNNQRASDPDSKPIRISAIPMAKNFICKTLNNLNVSYVREQEEPGSIFCCFITDRLPWEDRKKIIEEMERYLHNPKRYKIETL